MYGISRFLGSLNSNWTLGIWCVSIPNGGFNIADHNFEKSFDLHETHFPWTFELNKFEILPKLKNSKCSWQNCKNACYLRESQCLEGFEIAEFELNLFIEYAILDWKFLNFWDQIRIQRPGKPLKTPQFGYFIWNFLLFEIRIFFSVFFLSKLSRK